MSPTNDRIFCQEPRRIKSGISDVDLDPGHCVEKGGANDIQKQSTSGEDTSLQVVMVDRNKHGLVSDTWPSGDEVDYAVASPGDEVYLRLGSGSSEHNISKDEDLELAGDGTVQSAGTGSSPNKVVAQAKEALDNSGGSSEKLIKAEAVN